MAKKLVRDTGDNMKLPEVTDKTIELPEVNHETKENPIFGNPQNVITVDGESFEIKPTKLKYHRDRTAIFYHVLDKLPIPDILAADAGFFDEERNGDKCMFDFLIAVFDNQEFVQKHYNDMDSETIMRVLEIFKRINGITDKEDQSKNRMTKVTKA